MLKKIAPITFIIGNTIATATPLEPHNEPIVSVTPPKPNIMMVLDTAKSMGTKDMPKPNGYYPIKSGVDYRETSRGKVSRLASMQWTILGLFDKYRYQANIGLMPLDNGTAKAFDARIVPPRKIENDWDYNQLKEQLLSFKFSDRASPLNSTVYRASAVLRGKYQTVYGVLQFAGPVEYRCQEQHIILLTDGIHNSHTYTYGPLTEDKALQPNLNSLGKVLSDMDVIRQSGKKQPSNRNDRAGKDWRSTGYKKMPIYVHAVRFSNATTMAEDRNLAQFVSHTDKGIYLDANHPNEMELGFHHIFRNIAAPTKNSGSVEDKFGSNHSSDAIRYTSSYDPFHWSGEIKASRYAMVNNQEVLDKEIWSTNDTLKPNQGIFITSDDEGAAITLDKFKHLDRQAVLWLKGYSVQDYRARNGRLSDIIDSHLTYSAKDLLNINLTMLGSEVKKEFFDYLLQKNREQNHYNYLIAGSNDGLLNFLYADKASRGKGGQRHTSYFPSFFAKDIDKIVAKPYDHSFTVNGTNAIFDAKIDKDFKTLGITSMGAGKEALVGYQLYSSDAQTAIKPNFEIYRTAGFESLGYTYSDIEFINRHNEIGVAEALAIFGNGYTLHRSSDNQPSSLFIINAETGDKKVEIPLTGGKGGASTPAVIVSQDQDGLQQLEQIYVGDQSGKLFRISFDTSAPNPLETYTVMILFDAGDKHPITVKPTLVKDPRSAHIWVYFGTGRAILLEDNSKESLVTHNFYGIKDTGERVTLAQLDRQTIISQHTDNQLFDAKDKKAVLNLSNNVNGHSTHGWYLPIQMAGDSSPTGERVILPANIYNGTSIAFSTYGIHQDWRYGHDPCINGGVYGKIIFLDLFNGNGSRIIGKGAGVTSTETSFVAPTGSNINTGQLMSGQYTNDNNYKPIIDQLINDNGASSHNHASEVKTCDFLINDMNGDSTTINVNCNTDEPRRLYLMDLL